MTSETLVRVERHGLRGELVLNRPERRNALIAAVVEQLHAGLDELSADEAVHAILIRGEGGTLCAGLDLKARREEPALMEGFPGLWAAFHAAMYVCPRPIVGALEGHAIAGGSALALACDFLIAGENARLHVSEARMGMTAPVNVAWLELKFGYARAMELAVGGQPYNGRELVERGIALRAVPDERVLDEARAYADTLAENDPAAMAQVKSSLRTLTGVEDLRERITALQQSGRG